MVKKKYTLHLLQTQFWSKVKQVEASQYHKFLVPNDDYKQQFAVASLRIFCHRLIVGLTVAYATLAIYCLPWTLTSRSSIKIIQGCEIWVYKDTGATQAKYMNPTHWWERWQYLILSGSVRTEPGHAVNVRVRSDIARKANSYVQRPRMNYDDLIWRYFCRLDGLVTVCCRNR